MVQKETCQPDDTIIMANIWRMSSDGQIPITVTTKAGVTYTGLPTSMIAETGTGPALYMRGKGTADNNWQQRHAVIPLSSIDSLTFETVKGLLDNLVK